MEMGGGGVKDNTEVPVSGGLLFNPIVVWALHCFLTFTLTQHFVGGVIDWVFLTGISHIERIISTIEVCGDPEKNS